MERCGINSFRIRDGKDIEKALESFNVFSVNYQGAADDSVTISQQRKFK